MYRYDDIDQHIVAERVAQFRDQTRRFLAGQALGTRAFIEATQVGHAPWSPQGLVIHGRESREVRRQREVSVVMRVGGSWPLKGS